MRNFGLSLNETQRFLFRSVSIISLGLFVNQMLQTVGSIVLARVLGDPGLFGEVNLLLQIFGMVGLFLNVGFNSSLVYTFSTDAGEARQNRFRLALLGSTFFGVVVSLLLAASAPALSRFYHLPALREALIMSSIMLVFNSVANIGVSCFSGNRQFGTQAMFMVIMTVFSTLGQIFGVLWPIRQGNLLLGVSLWTGAGSVAAALIIMRKVQKVHRPAWSGPVPFGKLWKMMKYGVPLWAGNIAKAFQQPFLNMIIGSSSVVAVGYLASASRITGFIGIVTWAFMIVTFPFVAESNGNLPECRRRGSLCVRYNNILLYPLTLLICFYPNQINGFLFGDSFNSPESAAYIRLLALGTFFSSVGRLGGNILAGIGRTKANFWVMIIAGIFVIILAPFLAAANPVWAVSIYTGGWAVSALAMIVFFFIEGFPLEWWKAYGEPLIPSLVMGILLVAGRFAGSLAPLFIILGVLCMLVLSVFIETAGWSPRGIRKIRKTG